jgi:hypothetical protein
MEGREAVVELALDILSPTSVNLFDNFDSIKAQIVRTNPNDWAILTVQLVQCLG